MLCELLRERMMVQISISPKSFWLVNKKLETKQKLKAYKRRCRYSFSASSPLGRKLTANPRRSTRLSEIKAREFSIENPINEANEATYPRFTSENMIGPETGTPNREQNYSWVGQSSSMLKRNT